MSFTDGSEIRTEEDLMKAVAYTFSRLTEGRVRVDPEELSPVSRYDLIGGMIPFNNVWWKLFRTTLIYESNEYLLILILLQGKDLPPDPEVQEAIHAFGLHAEKKVYEAAVRKYNNPNPPHVKLPVLVVCDNRGEGDRYLRPELMN